MKTQGFLFGAALVSVLALSLSSCNQAGPTSGPDALSALNVGAFHGATVTTEGSTITAARSGDGAQGVMLRRSAVLVHFTVQGQNPRIRISRGQQNLVTPAAADNAVMIGPGGASSVAVFSGAGDQVVVNVTSVVDCGAAPEGVCTPPAFPPPPEGEAPRRGAAGAAAARAPAAATP